MNAPSDALSLLLEAIGLEDTLRAIDLLGGTVWHVPRALAPDHPWVEALGPEVAERLRAYAAGDTLTIPRDRGALDALVARDAASGMNQNQLARKYRMHVRSVRNALARHRERQARAAHGDIFGGL